MASLVRLAERERAAFVAEFLAAQEAADKARATEYRASIVLQSWWRGTAARGDMAGWHRAAVVIQRSYRGWLGRKHFRMLVFKALEHKYDSHYARKAAAIQSAWRGYASRKNGEDFYARKAFLSTLERNAVIVRAALQQEEEENRQRLEEQRAATRQQRRRRHLDKTSYLQSTSTIKGVYATRADDPQLESDLKLARTLPSRKRRPPSRRTPPPDPRSALSSTMPMYGRGGLLKTAPPKQQGPFLPPDKLLAARNRRPNPTLRAATTVDSERLAREQERQAHNAKVVHEAQFKLYGSPKKGTGTPPETASMRASLPFEDPAAYGRTRFREEVPTLPSRPAFRPSTRGVPLFDTL